MADDPVLRAVEVTKRFGGLQAVDGVNLDVREGTLTGIIGPNGAGKTTLFNVLAGFYPPTSGQVFLRGEDITRLPAHERSKKGLARTPEEQLHRVIGDTIRTLRKDKDLTLKQMARRTGLSVSLLSQIERAESSASISSLYKIAVALESRIQDLFGQY